MGDRLAMTVARVEQVRAEWPGLALQVAAQDIARPIEWRIREDRDVLVVHLGGRMDSLETEMDGHGGSSGPATVGEVWSVPAGRRYASLAQGGVVRFAALSIRADADRTIAPLAGARDDVLHGSAERLARLAVAADDASAMAAEALAGAIVGHVARVYSVDLREPAPRPSSPRLTPAQARTLREFIRANLAGRITLDMLAAQVGKTSHRLLVAFREAFGTTPAQYLISQRLRRAQWLLLHTRRDITAIALECGFSSHSHLTYAFARRSGRPPREFRARFASGDGEAIPKKPLVRP